MEETYWPRHTKGAWWVGQMASSLALCAHPAPQLVRYLSEMTSMARTETHLAPGPDGSDWELTAVAQGRAAAQEHTVTLHTWQPVLFPLLHTALSTATSFPSSSELLRGSWEAT